MSATPVHSVPLTWPWVCCTSLPVGSPPFPTRVARTFQKMDAVDGREAHEIVYRELERPLDQAVDEQRVFGRVDGRHAAVVHFVVQGGRGNDPACIMQRGHADGHGR